jgi:hypothetical protein
VNLQCLFSEHIISQTSLGGHASDVWLVKTELGEFVARSSGVDDSVDSPFLWACRNLFGIELSNTFDIEYINKLLNRIIRNITTPNVINKGFIDGRQVVVVEKINGINLNFLDKPNQMMEDFGKSIAEIHSHKFYECGAPNGDMRYSLETFPQKLINAIRDLSSRYYQSDTDIINKVDYYCKLALKIPIPLYATLIMLDMDSRQFLSDGKRVHALIDTEAYVLGPREMDLIALECCLDESGALSFEKGYSSVLSFPDLSYVRDVYRFLFCLLEIKGPSYDYRIWTAMPHLFN